jgi:mycoredoxin
VIRRLLLPAALASVALLAAGGLLWWQYQQSLQHDPRRGTGDKGIVVLVADWCGYCKRLEAGLRAAQVPYRALDVEDGGAGENAWFAIGRGGVPVTVVGQDIVHGYDVQRLNGLLRAQGYELQLR